MILRANADTLTAFHKQEDKGVVTGAPAPCEGDSFSLRPLKEKIMTTDHANDAKASFDDIYVKPDPRAYYSVLGSLDYAIPELAKPIFRQLAGAWRKLHGRDPTILDLGSSYGINAALYRYPLTFDMLRRRYARRAMLALPSDEVRILDRNYFKAWPRIGAGRLVLADTSAPAIEYALAAGLADAGVTGSFEDRAPDGVDAEAVADVDIVVSTGCVGYVTETTFAHLVGAMRKPPWVVSFVLRMFDFAPVARVLNQWGLRTEKLETAAFVQRRFRDEEEAYAVLDVLDRRGIDAAGFEADGLYFAELFVSRPDGDIRAAPLAKCITVASGRNLNFGPRLVRVDRPGGSDIAPVKS